MVWKFNAEHGLIVLPVEVAVHEMRRVLNLALDTGATHTYISAKLLPSIGIHASESPNKVQVTTGSGEVLAPVVSVTELSVLGQKRESFEVTAIDLPPSASVDGVLGLDFLRGFRVFVDFREGQVEFT